MLTLGTESGYIWILKALTVFIALYDFKLYKQVAFSLKLLNGFQSCTQFFSKVK